MILTDKQKEIRKDQIVNGVSTLNKICKWMKDNNDRKPTVGSEDRQEDLFAQWINRKRRAKSGKNTEAFHDVYQDVAEVYGYPWLFKKQR